ncbi:DNA-directed RNA polymerase sigma-70 factor [Paenibacillus sp. J45TS6]|uniref:sigma-70 family RNA polymerase sigma factor n=1 Tax=Paenibacillus sp. J45TS6 TaxID=2807196 RepID=UPI001B03DC26|nr:sigma-70 family RNA polymerase sigma factor [Paenibacillus sp. J45TS6]GIP42821.1 DNA-directed RNA polymerase sigma-70 factor [Paenibacillus sp. J45TS6]
MDLIELAVKAKQGDEEAFLERMSVDKHKLYGIAYSYMLNQQDALDVVQETVSKVWAKRKSLKQPEYFTTWVIRILIRVCMDEQKKKRREVPTAADHMGYDAVLAPQSVDSDHKLDMEKRIRKLQPKYRMVIVLKYYRDLTIPDIAELMNKPEGTIRTWLHKGLKQMRIEMMEEEDQEVKESPWTEDRKVRKYV